MKLYLSLENNLNKIMDENIQKYRLKGALEFNRNKIQWKKDLWKVLIEILAKTKNKAKNVIIEIYIIKITQSIIWRMHHHQSRQATQ